MDLLNRLDMTEKLKKGTILGPTGDTVAEPNDTDAEPALETAAQALIETRVNAALDQLRVHNDQQIKTLIDDYKKKWRWRWVAVAVALTSTAWGAFTWFVAPEKIKAWIGDYVQKNVAEPALKLAVTEAAQKEASNYAETKLAPLELRAKKLESQIESIIEDVHDKQAVLSAEQANLGELINIQALAVSSKNGGQNAYNELKQIADGVGKRSEIARLYMSDVAQFYEADRNQLFYQMSIDPATGNEAFLTLEESIKILGAGMVGSKVREAIVNGLCVLEAKTAVESLVSRIMVEKDLRVIARITRAINKITGNKFGPLDRDAVVMWWSNVPDKEIYTFPYDECSKWTAIFDKIPMYILKDYSLDVSSEKAAKAVGHLQDILKREPKAVFTRFHLIAVLLSLDRLADAESELRLIQDSQPNAPYTAIARAMIHMKRGAFDAASADINSLLTRLPGQASKVRQFAVFSSLNRMEKIRWPTGNQLQ